MKRSNLTIALYLFLVFASGAVVGAFGFRLYSGTPVAAKNQKMSPEEWRRQYFGEMQSRLKLTQNQMQQLNEIYDQSRARFRAAHEKNDTTIRQIREEQLARVRAMLTDEQRPEYEKLRAERDARAKATGKK